MAIYQQITKDNYLTGQIATLKNKVLSEGFAVVDDKGKENHELLKLFQRPWFFEFLSRVLDTDFYGHTLINFDYPNEVGEFERFDIIPRGQVVPEMGQVLLRPTDDVGIPFRDFDADYTKLLLEVRLKDEEGRDALGILNKAAPEIIWKRYSRIDWSRRSEKFGMPLITLKSDATDDSEISNKEQALANMGANGWMIVDTSETLEIKESSSNQDGSIYKALTDACNDEIAYLISGQTATSQETGSRAGGEVHERVQEHYIQARMRFVFFFVNYELFPFLKQWGYQLEGYEWKWRKWIDEDQARLNPPKPPKPEPTDDPEKDTPAPPNARGPKGKAKLATPNFPEPTAQPSAVGTDQITLASGESKLKQLFDAVLRKLHTDQPKLRKMLRSPEWRAMYQETASQLSQGVQEGYGMKLPELEFGKPDAVLLGKLTQHLYVFSANKSYQLLVDLNGLLVKAGQVRPYGDFEREALQLHQDYNVSWLRTEYDTAVATGQMAAKWLTFQDDADKYFLKYSTVGDDRVRPTHAELHGVLRPVDDPFWNTHYPPLGWKCRCNVVRVPRAGRTATAQEDLDKLSVKPPEFGHNAGKTGVVFPESHQYYDVPEGVKPLLRRMADEDAPQPKRKARE
ncbi:DUF935 family protein [Hymenobacter sp. B81]|uniref:phage portal protein family protein n=1 Tax=Hymenobacter sp. B81 TaxID=3344878 RepID=UPI0037DC35FE